MSWVDEDFSSYKALQWWKDSFSIAAFEFFKAVDNCVTNDIQVSSISAHKHKYKNEYRLTLLQLHNTSWTVQEVENARMVADILSEDQVADLSFIRASISLQCL